MLGAGLRKINFSDRLLVNNSFHSEWDGDTKRKKQNSDYPAECYTGSFACLLHCTKPNCKESHSVAGIAATGIGDEGQYQVSGIPKCIYPPPPLISIPENCPSNIKSEVEAAFLLYWYDKSVCLNRIRNAVELILTDIRIKRHGKRADGSRTILSLDSRIQILRNRGLQMHGMCDKLLAVKHLGNAGSHPSVEVNLENVFDGFDILEKILLELYSSHSVVLSKSIKQIILRKGPRKKVK